MIQPARDPKKITSKAAVINFFAFSMFDPPLPWLDEQGAKKVKMSNIWQLG
jgi:hypothetical protein